MDVNVIGPQQTVAVLTPQLSVDAVILNMTSGLGSLETAVDRISAGTTRAGLPVTGRAQVGRSSCKVAKPNEVIT
jgi:hypothetical protein